MSTRSSEYLEAIDHLPAGATLVMPGVGWEQYEDLLNDLVDRPGVRISYDGGRLEIMTPLPEHEEYKEFISDLARALSEESGIPLEKRGSATWKRRRIQKGVEPDTCFYVANAHRIAGKRKIDLETDPPPDIAVEIDTTNESLSKFPIYAALGVPEIWRYDGKRVQIYQLKGDAYVETDASSFFLNLSGSMLTESLDLSKAQSQTEALKLFRQRIRARKAD
jgi:Uma2 family endonuclease